MRYGIAGASMLVAASAACGGSSLERRVAYANGRRDQAAEEAERWVDAVPRCTSASALPDLDLVEIEGAVLMSRSISVTLLACEDARLCCNSVRPDEMVVRGRWKGTGVRVPIVLGDSEIFPPMFRGGGAYDCEWDEWRKVLVRRRAVFRLRGRWEAEGERKTFRVLSACRLEEAPK